MRRTYSLYEAKAHLSAIVRQVRAGQSVVVTVHGEPAVEITPVRPAARGIEKRIAEMTGRGELIPAASRREPLAPIARRPGALKRFLRDRDG